MKSSVQTLKEELAKFAHKVAEDRLTVAASGNISARKGNRIYIKAKGIFFERANPSDFVGLDISHPSLKRDRPRPCVQVRGKTRPSFEYQFHIACYKRRPEVNAVLHTHPLITTTFYSAGIERKPLTLEFALYIASSIATVSFFPPGTKELAAAVGEAISGHDAVVMKKHGLVTVGQNLQEAYLKALIVEREARAQLICRLFKKSPPFLRKDEIYSIGAA